MNATYAELMRAVSLLDSALGALTCDLERVEGSITTGSREWTVLAGVYDRLMTASVHVINIGADLAQGRRRPVGRALRRSLRRVDEAVDAIGTGIDLLSSRYGTALPSEAAGQLWDARQRLSSIKKMLRAARAEAGDASSTARWSPWHTAARAT